MKNLLYARAEQIMEIDPIFLAALEELVQVNDHTDSDLDLHETIAFASKALVQKLYAINQFVQVDQTKLKKLESIYLRTWMRILKTRNVQAVLTDYHYPALSRWIVDLYPVDFRQALKSVPLVGQVVGGEYSPQLQIKLLRIDLRTIQQPVIDIGCGSNARLVRYLRTLKIETWGIDRSIDNPNSYLWLGDWFDYDFERDTWGTIISHMALTNHLVYTHQFHGTRLEMCLDKFAEIIESLKVGGSFYYAPSVPFAEQLLDASKYSIGQFPIIDQVGASRIIRIAQ